MRFQGVCSPARQVPLAAMGLALVMLGALITHARRGEYLSLAIQGVLVVLAAHLAYGRLALAPLQR